MSHGVDTVNEISLFSLAPAQVEAVASRTVTVGKVGERTRTLFTRCFEALLKERDLKPNDLAKLTGMSAATFSHIKGGTRGASFETLERIGDALHVPVSTLFDENTALAELGLARDSDTTLSRSGALAGNRVSSSASLVLPEGGLMQHPDHELLTALVSFWDAISPAGRLELVALGHRLKGQSTEHARSKTAG